MSPPSPWQGYFIYTPEKVSGVFCVEGEMMFEFDDRIEYHGSSTSLHGLGFVLRVDSESPNLYTIGLDSGDVLTRVREQSITLIRR